MKSAYKSGTLGIWSSTQVQEGVCTESAAVPFLRFRFLEQR